MKKTPNHSKQVTLETIEKLINNKNYFRITSNDETCKTAIGNVGNKSLRITVVYYLQSVVFTDLISAETIHYKLI